MCWRFDLGELWHDGLSFKGVGEVPAGPRERQRPGRLPAWRSASAVSIQVTRTAHCWVTSELLSVTGLGPVQMLAGMGGIQGFPARASRMTVKASSPCLAAVDA